MSSRLLSSGCYGGPPAHPRWEAVVSSRSRTQRSRGKTPSAPRPGRSALLVAVPLVVAAFVVGLLLGRPVADVTDEPPRDPVAELRAQEAQRDVAQIGDLTKQARRIHDELLPVLEGLEVTMPVGSPAGPPSLGPVATREQVAGWQAVTARLVEEFAERPSAGTGVNIARSGLAASLHQLDLAVAGYAQALDAPDRDRWLLASGRQRDIGIMTWSVAATQLDLLSVEAGRGHVHVFLPSRPGQGALTSDGAPEGPG